MNPTSSLTLGLDVLLAFAPGIFLLAVLWFLTSRREPENWPTLLALFGPLFLSTGVAYLVGNVYPVLAATLYCILFNVWYTRVRFPIQFIKASKPLKAGHWNEALALLNEAVAARPHMWQIYQVRAAVHAQAGNFIDALQDAHQAIQLNPGASHNYNALGHAYWQQEEYAQAKQAYLEAYRLAPQMIRNQYNLGLAHFRLGEFAEAEERFGSLLARKHFPGFPKGFRLLATYYLARAQEALGKPAQAEQSYARMTRFARGLDEVRALRNGALPPTDLEVIADVERYFLEREAIAS